MELDGDYAIAQLEKLDYSPLFQGRCIPICSMLAKYLMPQLLPGRMKTWVEQYGRLPDTFITTEVCFVLLPHEAFPAEVSDYAEIECAAVRNEDGVWTVINYSGSMASFRAMRERVFGTSVLHSIKITEPLTDEELQQMNAWEERYSMAWPYIDYDSGDRLPHKEVRVLYDNMKTHYRLWTGLTMQPPEGASYVERDYIDGVLQSEVNWIAVQDDDELSDAASESSDEFGWD